MRKSMLANKFAIPFQKRNTGILPVRQREIFSGCLVVGLKVRLRPNCKSVFRLLI
jgi:hypothetical protein